MVRVLVFWATMMGAILIDQRSPAERPDAVAWRRHCSDCADGHRQGSPAWQPRCRLPW